MKQKRKRHQKAKEKVEIAIASFFLSVITSNRSGLNFLINTLNA